MATQTETIQVGGVRCEKCVMRLAHALEGHEGLEGANANLMGQVTLAWNDEQTSREAIRRAPRQGRLSRARGRLARNSHVPAAVREGMAHAGTVDRMDAEPEEAQRLATEARDRVRFEEDALALSDQVYRVARHLANSREDADELMQETYARAFRSWRSFTPGTNMRAWLLRILTNLNIDRGRRQQRAPQMQPLEANDYFLYDRLAENGDGISDEEQVVERLSQDDIVTALSAVPHDFRDVIVLVDLGDFSYADAAQILDIPVGTVMSRLHRGRRILKRELAESALEEAT